MVQYFQQRQHLHVYPPDPFADSAEEVGPVRSFTAGPCLVLFSNVQLSPQQLNRWLQGSFMERPCCRLYWMDRTIPAQQERTALVQAIISAALPQDVTAVRLDAYPKSIELQLGDELVDAGYPAPMKPSGHSHVLFVVHMPDTGLWRWSYMDRQLLWRHQPDQPARFNKSVATAINKIAEAMQVLNLHSSTPACSSHHSTSCAHSSSADSQCPQVQPEDLQQQQPRVDVQPAVQPQQDCCWTTARTHPPSASASAAAAGGTGPHEPGVQRPMRWAIDVGACPGGWSSYLADSCGYSVIAIDPADLHPDVKARPGVHHIKAKAEDALESIDQLLQGQQADLLVCDANDHVTQLPQFLGPVLPKLKSGGWLVITLKFYGRGSKVNVAENLAMLLPELEPGRCLWLLANTLFERTYVARKR